ncbi:2-C-methyl-D-erythritol 4-phosphate cytidylyltransferase [Alistipes sp.]|uniref:2-C-methyl-D-erythritol 4-phosphate cytidylyltransferase n=1 Tax=Alistipes sp. TaxID=1872444 RepID=UPI003A846794
MESITSHIGVVVVAGGSGSRMGNNLPKQFMLLDGLPILAHTINNFAEALPDAEIVVVLPADYIGFWQDYARRFDVAAHRTAAGGAERFHSVANGIAALSDVCTLIGVQDGVRPLATHDCIRRIARTAEREGSAVPVVRPVDSFRIVAEDGTSHPVDRATLRSVQTPQFFRAEALRSAYAQAFDPAFTDDATVFEAAGGSLRLVEGEPTNLKITTRDDLAVAESILKQRNET